MSKLPVPLTVAVQLSTLPWPTEVEGQDAVTPVMAFGASTILKLALFVWSPTEVAVMTAFPLAGRVAGAVYAPALDMLPAVADQV